MTTKTAQFTPGPWYVHSNKIAVGDKDRHIIADIRGMEAFGSPTPDANLIAAAPAMYDRHKDNHGMVQEALRFLYEGEYEEVKCLLNHIALNSKQAVRQAEGRQA